MADEASLRVAEALKSACIEAALAAYEDAKVRGLCHEGAWECAIEALRSLDVRALAEADAPKPPESRVRD